SLGQNEAKCLCLRQVDEDVRCIQGRHYVDQRAREVDSISYSKFDRHLLAVGSRLPITHQSQVDVLASIAKLGYQGNDELVSFVASEHCDAAEPHGSACVSLRRL